METIKTQKSAAKASSGRSVANNLHVGQTTEKSAPQFDNRPESIAQRQWIARIGSSPVPAQLQCDHSSSINNGASVVSPQSIQRQVIQLVKGDNIKPLVARIKSLSTDALKLIGGAKYDYAKAKEKYEELREEVKKVNEAHAKPSKVAEDTATNGQRDEANATLTNLIDSFKSVAQSQLDPIALEFNTVFEKYAGDIHKLSDQIATNIEANDAFLELKTNLQLKVEALSEEFSPVRSQKFAPIKAFFDTLGADLEYDNGRDDTSTLPNSSLKAPDFAAINKAGNLVINLSKIYYDNKKATLPEGEGARNALAVKFLAGTHLRVEKLAEVIVEPASQLLVFKQLNKKHRNDPISEVVALIKHFSAEKLAEALTLIEKVGEKAGIARINTIIAAIPVKFAEHTEEFVLAFVNKTGKSTEEDWKKLLDVKDWEKEHVLALAMAFDKNNGNATADDWQKAALKDDDLKTKPDEVRAAARVDMFSSDDWYDKAVTKPSSGAKAKKKYNQLLYALLGEESLDSLKDIDVSAMRGDFLSMLIFFHKHIASFSASGGKGFDRESLEPGSYARSSKEHPINEQYKDMLGDVGGKKADLLMPLNLSLLGLQGDSGSVSATPLGPTSYVSKTIPKFSTASAGLPSHNLKILGELQSFAAHKNDAPIKKKLFGSPEKGSAKLSRTVVSDTGIMDSLIGKQKTAATGKIGMGGKYTSFHDYLLTDRGAMVKSLSEAINTISGGSRVLNAIGSEGHPSLILLIPKPASKQYKYGKKTYTDTKSILSDLVDDFNSASQVKMAVRGSFGFQRPSAADTGDSIRIWPGYAPVEALLPGLKNIVEKIRDKASAPALGLSALTTDTDKPILHIEALKAAMRHAYMALNTKIDKSAPDDKKRVYEWLRTRLLIKLKQSELLLTKGSTLFKTGSPATQSDKNKHFSITADMTDKLQEYAMLFTAATLTDTENPNKNHLETGKFKDVSDPFEKMMRSKLNPTDYRVFYLDSGEQALITAGILANRFQKGKDESDVGVAKSKYISRNPYFEIGLFKGDKRSNLEHDDLAGTIVHADLSPVITDGRSTQKPKAEILESVKRTWQKSSGAVEKAGVIPIIDITNSTVDDVVSLGNMPNNFIIVESLTKHQQLGADKFIRGRLVAVSKTAGTTGLGPLLKTNFLDLAQKIVGPVANESFNPLLAKIRVNMDKALYSEEM